MRVCSCVSGKEVNAAGEGEEGRVWRGKEGKGRKKKEKENDGGKGKS